MPHQDTCSVPDLVVQAEDSGSFSSVVSSLLVSSELLDLSKGGGFHHLFFHAAVASVVKKSSLLLLIGNDKSIHFNNNKGLALVLLLLIVEIPSNIAQTREISTSSTLELGSWVVCFQLLLWSLFVDESSYAPFPNRVAELVFEILSNYYYKQARPTIQRYEQQQQQEKQLGEGICTTATTTDNEQKCFGEEEEEVDTTASTMTSSIARRKGARSKYNNGGILGGAVGSNAVLAKQTVLMLLALALALLIFTIGIAFGSRGLATTGGSTTTGIPPPVTTSTSSTTRRMEEEGEISNSATTATLKRVKHDHVLRHPNQDAGVNTLGMAAGENDEEEDGSLNNDEYDDDSITQQLQEEELLIDNTPEIVVKKKIEPPPEVLLQPEPPKKKQQHHNQLRSPPKALYQNRQQLLYKELVNPNHDDMIGGGKKKMHDKKEDEGGIVELHHAMMDRQRLNEEVRDGHGLLEEDEESHLEALLNAHAEQMKDFDKHHVQQDQQQHDANQKANVGNDKNNIIKEENGINHDENDELDTLLKAHAEQMKDFDKHHHVEDPYVDEDGSKNDGENNNDLFDLDEDNEKHLEALLNAHAEQMKEFDKHHVGVPQDGGDEGVGATKKHYTKEELEQQALEALHQRYQTHQLKDAAAAAEQQNKQNNNNDNDETSTENYGIELHSATRASLPNLMSNLFKSDGSIGTKFLFSAWIYIDPPESRDVGIKRILSVGPEISGCHDDDAVRNSRLQQQVNGEDSQQSHGHSSGMIRLYVNHDETADECLVLEWSPGVGRGCYVVEGIGEQVESRTWVHVGFSIDPTLWTAKLYLNGQLIEEEQNDEAAGLSMESMNNNQNDGGTTNTLLSDTSNPSSVMLLGRGTEQTKEHVPLSMTLDGRMSSIMIWKEASTEQRILNSPLGEVGLMERLYEKEQRNVNSTSLVKHLGELKPDYFYPLRTEGMEAHTLLVLGKDVDISLKEEVNQSQTPRDGHYQVSYLDMSSAHVVTSDGAGDERVHVDAAPHCEPIKEETTEAKSRYDTYFANFVPKGGRRYEEYKTGTYSKTYTSAEREASDQEARLIKREAIKDAMIFTWERYRQCAFGYDEIRPVTGQADNGWKGMGVTLVDSLDTLWLMNMKDEFWEARDWVRDHLTYDHIDHVGIFEITIRNLGGLLSAYDLSGDDVFLTAAEDLGSRLLSAFDSPNGIPYGQTELNGRRSFNEAWQGGSTKLAECGTLQMEFRYLSEATGNPIYATKANAVFDQLAQVQPDDGLYPLFVRNDVPYVVLENEHVTLGANADSFYEYMLKVWLQGGQLKNETSYRTMWDKAMKGVHKYLVHRSTPSGLTYVAERKYGIIDHQMDHLACFISGALALGAYTSVEGIKSKNAQRDLILSKQLAYTCYQMYARTATGLSPEFVIFRPEEEGKYHAPKNKKYHYPTHHDDDSEGNGGGEDFYVRGAIDYRLRPEVVESLFVLYQLTGDLIYREWGWEIFQAISKYCRTQYGYGTYPNVNHPTAALENKMESFFLAETLKYLYLLFDPDTPIDILHTHVFNTEAHPLRRFDVLRRDGGANAGKQQTTTKKKDKTGSTTTVDKNKKVATE